MKRTTRNNIATLIILAALAFIVFSILQFNTNVNKELEQSASNTLEDIAYQQQLSFDREFDTMLTLLNNAANTLAVIGHDENAILEYVNSLRADFHFDSIIITDTQGVGILNTGEIERISDMTFFQPTLKGEVVTSLPYKSSFTNNDVIAISAPIYYDGDIEGVIAVEYTLTYLNSLLSASTGLQGYAMVVDSNADVLFSSNENHIKYEELQQAEFYDGKTVENYRYNIENQIEGDMSFSYNSIKSLTEYRPLKYNDWSLVFVMQEEYLLESTRNITANMIMVSIIIVVCFVAFIAYVLMLKKSNMQEIEKIAFYDDLTGLSNLSKFKIDARALLTKYPNKQFVMVKMDLINFKAINELFGYETGNKVICAIAETGRAVKESTFLQARVGSDEFMLFSGGDLLVDMDKSRDIYENLFKQILSHMDKHQFSFRYGRYFIAKGETDIIDIINKASMAHSFAKAEGGNLLWDYDDKFKQRILYSTEITNRMRTAMENGEFKAYLQPKYKVSDNSVIGAEALVRWIDDKGKMIYPNDFIPIFEANGFITELDKYMLDCVCATLKEWMIKGYECIPVSVNFSRLHIKNDDFINELNQITEKYGVPKKYIEIELTETAVTENESELCKLFEALRAEGYSVSIDDFGSGYSSLGMLKNFKVDTLKLDRSFFVDNKYDERGDIVVDSIIKLAHSLDMYTVAEGIEESEQVDFLKEVDCEAVQGYFYARPMSIADFEKTCFKSDKD